MSVELCFLIDLLSDFSLISAAARGMGFFRLRRCALAAALAALYGTLARTLPMLAGPPVQLALLLPLSMLATQRTDARTTTACAMTLTVTAIVTGTCAAYCRHIPLAIIAVPMLCGMTTRLRRDCLSLLSTRVELVNGGQIAVLCACVDTGNHLTEPLSGQPVLIVNANLVERILPDTGYRQVAYGSVGGAGELRCFRPEHIYIDIRGRRQRAPDSWVALFPDRLPGPAQALAPASYILQ